MKKKALVIATLLLLTLAPASLSLVNTTDATTIGETKVETKADNIVTKPGGTIKAALGEQARQVNPCQIASAYDDALVNRMFEPLATSNPKDPFNYDKYVPIMAEDWTRTIEKDHTVDLRNDTSSADIPGWGGTLGGPTDMTKYVINLRDNYYFHDGEPVTAEDLAFSYQFQQWVTYYGSSQNLDQYYGPGNMDYVTANTINDTAVEVFIGATGFYQARAPLWIYVYPKHIYADGSTWGGSGTFNIDNWWEPGWDVTQRDVVSYEASGPNDPILTGNGAWVNTYWDAQIPENARTYLFSRFDDYYWNPINEETGKVKDGREWINPEGNYDKIYDTEDPYYWGPYAPEFRYRVIQTSSAAWTAFAEEEIDLVGGRAAISHLKTITELGYPIIKRPENDISGVSIQCDSSYLTRQRQFRQALAYAVDKREVIEIVRGGFGTPIDTPVSPAYGEYYWDPEENGETDLTSAIPGTARDMIANNLDEVNDEAGEDYLQGSPSADWTDDNGNIQLEYDVRSATVSLQEADAIKEDLKAAGIKVKFNEIAWSTMVGRLMTGGFEASQHGWSVGGLPPVDLFYNESAYYSTYQWDNATMYEKVNEYLNARNQSAALDPVRKCQEILYENQPFLTIYTDTVVQTYRSSKWAGIVIGSLGGYTADSYKKMAIVESRPGQTAAGFDSPHGVTVSGEKEFSGTVQDKDQDVDPSIARVWVDKDKQQGRVPLSNKTPLTSDIILWSWDYEIDTTQLQNGWHTLNLEVQLESGEVFSTYYLSFKVDNPSIAQDPMTLSIMTGVLSATIVGAIIYVAKTRKGPPKE